MFTDELKSSFLDFEKLIDSNNNFRAFSISTFFLDISYSNFAANNFGLFFCEISKACFRLFGRFTFTTKFSFIFSGALTPIILSKSVFDVKSSVFAEIKFALAPAKDDSD